MSNKRELVLLVVAAAIIAGLVFLFVDFESEDTGTATPAPTSTTPPTVTTTTATSSAVIDVPSNPDTDETEDTVRQALSVAFTWYPATDRSPTDAYARARNWFTEPLAASLLAGVHTERGPGAQWSQWASDNAKIVADVSVGCSGCPPDTDTLIHRAASIHQTVIVGDETTTVTPDTTVWITLTKGGGQWLIGSIRY
ncbi:hypothetical protein FFI94_032845 [Rhodococcus sp. KBS0724]|uniref:hypothetical protein n=1 Tax=Rhodococcus sp. KBS0724 TaxID=1179674 RepID=UPI00110E9E06|nr:hypothetical protein [Rhodococcus sp. KBS0724]TSD40483.1 hypothetical protein FFI94_032845 [Rhodococcus sp. KBS0724]